MEKACDLLKERLASIQEFLHLSSQDDQETNKKFISSCVVKMKRQEKIRAQKENEILEALFTFKSASKNERINFEKTSYELMVILSPQFEYQVQDKGFYTDIAEMYIAYYSHINNPNKVEEIKVINQNNIYHNFPFLCMLYKGLVEFSKKIFQEKVKIVQQTAVDHPLVQKKENTNSINNQKRNENSFIQIEQKIYNPKCQDKQNINVQMNAQPTNQIDNFIEQDQNPSQQDLKEELLSNNNVNLKSGDESFRQLNPINDQKVSKLQANPINLNRKRGSYLNNQCTLHIIRSETPENTKFSGGAYSSTNSSQNASASQMFKKYFSSKMSNESVNEEKKTFLGHQKYYSNLDKEKFLFYQFCVLPPTTIPQTNFQAGFNNAHSSFSSSIQVNTPVNNCITQKNSIPQSTNNIISEQQQMIQNSHQQALSCPQFTRRNYFRIVKEAVEDAEFMVFKRNELLAMYYYKNIVARNNNIAKTIESFRTQLSTKSQNKAEQKITEKLQQNLSKNGGNLCTLPYINADCSLTTPNNKIQLNKTKVIKIDVNLINNSQKQNDMSQTPEKQKYLLPNITNITDKSNSKNFSDFLGKKQICTNNQPTLNSIQNIQSIYQNSNQKLIKSVNQNRSSSQSNQFKKNQNNNKSSSNGIICEKNKEISDEIISIQKSEITKKVQIGDNNDEKSNSSKIHDTQDTDQSLLGKETQILKVNSKEEIKKTESNQNQMIQQAQCNEITFHFNEIKIDNQINKNTYFLPETNNCQTDTLQNKNDQMETQDTLKENRQLLDEIQEEENTNRDLYKEVASSSLDKFNQEQKIQYATPKTHGQKPVKQLLQSSTEEKKITLKQKNLDFLERNLSISQSNQDKFRVETSSSDFKKQKRRQQSKSQHQELRYNQQGTSANSQQDMNQTIYDKIKICDDLINQENSVENQYIIRLQEDYSHENKQNQIENRNIFISSSNPQKKITASSLQKADTNNSFGNSSKKNQQEHISFSNKENIPLIPKSRNSNIEESRNQKDQCVGGIFDFQQQFQQQLIEQSADDKVCQFKQRIIGKNKIKENICNVFVHKSNKSRVNQKQTEASETVINNNQKEQFIKQLTNKLQEILTVNKDSIKKIEIVKNLNQNEIQNDEAIKLPQFKQENGNGIGNKATNCFNKNTPQASQNKKNFVVNLNTSYEQNDRKKQFSRNQGQNRIIENDKSLNIIKDFQLDLSTPVIAPAGHSEYISLKSKNKQSQRSKSIQNEGVNGFNYSKCQDTQTKNIDNIIQSNFTTISQQQQISITNPISQNMSIDIYISDPNQHIVNNQVKKQIKQSQIPKKPKINQNLSTRNALQQTANNRDEQDNTKYQLTYQSYAHHAKVQNLKCKEFYNLLCQGQVSNSNTTQSTKLPFESNNTSSQQSNVTDNKQSIETPYSSSSRYIKRRSLRSTQMAGCGVAAAKSFLSTSNNYENKVETDQVQIQQNFNNLTQNTTQATRSMLPCSINGFSTQSNNISNLPRQDDSQSFCDTQIRERNSISLNQAINSYNNKNALISNQESPISTSFAVSKAKKICNKTVSEQPNQEIKQFDSKLQNEIGNYLKSQQNKFKSILQDYNLVQKDGKIVQHKQNKLVKSSLE